MAEMIAMLNGLPTNMNEYMMGPGRSVMATTAYNPNLAGLGAVAGPNKNPVQPQRGKWQRRGLQQGLSLTAAATLQGTPTNDSSVSAMVRRDAEASSYYNRQMAGVPESVADAAAAARAGTIVSQYYSPNLAGLGADAAPTVSVQVPGAAASMSIGEKAMYGVAGLAVGYFIAKMMK
jgi:hypothetical protein